MLYLVDAYNWLLRTSVREIISSRDLENWIESTAELLRACNKRCSLIFDGTKSPDALRRYSLQGIEVVFTAQGQTADEYILEVLRAARRNSCKVVTSDRRLARLAEELGADNLSIAAFTQILMPPQKEGPKVAESSLLQGSSGDQESLSASNTSANTWANRQELMHLQKIFEQRYHRVSKKNL